MISKKINDCFAYITFYLVNICAKLHTNENHRCYRKKRIFKGGINLHIETFISNGFKLHFVKTGSDSLSTLFFVHRSTASWDAFKEYLQDSDLLKKLHGFY